jgi:hypothetical protein
MRLVALLLVLLASGDAFAQGCIRKYLRCGDRVAGVLDGTGCRFLNEPDWQYSPYAMELTAGTVLTITMTSGAFPPRLNIYYGIASQPILRIRAEGSTAKATFEVPRTGTYRFAAFSEERTKTGPFFLDIECEGRCVAPFETPRNVRLTYDRKPGEVVALAAYADGAAPLQYRWYDTRVPLVTLGTDASFTSPPLYQSTSFAVTVTNGCGELTLPPFEVTVAECKPPEITKHPFNVRVDYGAPARFWVEVTGTPPFEYAWYEGLRFDVSRAVYGNTGSSTLDLPRATHDTSYWVRVSNGCGTSDSFEARLEVNGGTRRRSSRK